MTALEIKQYIEQMISHITFTYNGKNCGVDPILYNKRYDMWYGEDVFTAKSVDEVMNKPFFNGKSLSDIAEIIELD